MSIHNSPSMGSVNEISSFMFFCQKVLPLVYDDSLSYYETLCKVAHKLNEVIESASVSQENINKLKVAYDELLVYINDALKNVDNRVVNLVDAKVNEMVENGEIVIDPALVDAAPDGYGLGGISTTIDSWDNATANGWYASNTGGPTADWWLGVVFNYANTVIVQKVWMCTPSTPLKCYQRMYDSGTWGDWENISKSAFAPAGYGLGMTSCEVITSLAALDATVKNGKYYLRLSGSELVADTYQYGNVEVTGHDNWDVTQTLIATGDTTKLSRRGRQGNWQPWEYVNPPMVPGVEYRTTERWNGKAVYKKLIDVGTLPNGVTKTFTNLITGYTGIVGYRLIGYSADAIKDYTTESYFNTFHSGITINTNGDLSSFSGSVYLEYIKD